MSFDSDDGSMFGDLENYVDNAYEDGDEVLEDDDIE